MYQISRSYNFLPKKQKNITSEIIINEIGKNIRNLNSNDKLENYQIKLGTNVINKLVSKEWQIEDYISFIKAIRHSAVESVPKYSMPAIIKLFEVEEEQLKKDLNSIEEATKGYEISLYPYQEGRTKMDAFRMITVLTSRVNSVAAATAQTIYKTDDNSEAYIEMLNNAINKTEDDSFFLVNYEQTFGFLKDLESYHDLYLSYKEVYLKKLREVLSHQHEIRKNEKEKISNEYHIGKVIEIAEGKCPKVMHLERFVNKQPRK